MLKTINDVSIAAFMFFSIAMSISAALFLKSNIIDSCGKIEKLPKIYDAGLKIERALPKMFAGLRRQTTTLLDDLARHGVTKNSIEPWSQLVGGDGNSARYQREMNIFGMYMA